MLGCSGPLRTLRVCMDHRDRAAKKKKNATTPLISPTVASHGEMWTMLMQMIPSADAIGQTECDASRAIGARTFVTSVAFTHAATLSWASGSRSEGWKTRAGKFLAKWTTCSPEPLAISRMTPCPRQDIANHIENDIAIAERRRRIPVGRRSSPLPHSGAPAPGWPIAQRKTRRQTAKERTRRCNRIVDHSRL